MRTTAGGGETRLWWGVFALLVAACATWAFAMPPMTGPDEGSQSIRAAAVARGEMTGDHADGPTNWLVTVRVPEAFATSDVLCFLGHPRRGGFGVEPEPRTDCDTMPGGRELVDATTNQYRNQPFYYLAVGLPSLAFPSETGAYLMRLVNAVLCSALLAAGLLSLRRLARPTLALCAAAVTLTPTFLYLGGIVNTAGLEIASGFCLWAAGLAVVRGSAIDGRDVRRAGIALVVLALTRGSSPFFAVLIVACLAVLAGRERRRSLVRRLDVRAWLAGGAVAVVASGAWLAYIGSEYPVDEFAGNGLRAALGEVGWWSREMVGTFGSTDVAPPVVIQLGWLAAILVVVAVAARAGTKLGLLIGVGLAILSYAILISGEGFGVPQTGFYWQGRYVMPVLVGAVLTLAATAAPAADGEERDLRLANVLLPVLLVGHLWSLLYALRHYTVGIDGGIDPREFLLEPIWSPPIPGFVLVTAALMSLVGLGMVLVRPLEPNRPDDDRPVDVVPEAVAV